MTVFFSEIIKIVLKLLIFVYFIPLIIIFYRVPTKRTFSKNMMKYCLRTLLVTKYYVFSYKSDVKFGSLLICTPNGMF